jgi:hypothetical protein
VVGYGMLGTVVVWCGMIGGMIGGGLVGGGCGGKGYVSVYKIVV